jgi:hypothetical protein
MVGVVVVTKYVKWKHRERGFINGKGDHRNCLHCGRMATESCVRKQGKFTMELYMCDTHRERARSTHK